MILSSIYSVLMLMICVFINQIAYFLFGINSLAFEIIAPLNEESLRFISVIKGRPLCWMFTLLIAFFEFITYINLIINELGYLPMKMLLIRIWCIVLHFILLSIQLYGWKLYKKKNKKVYLVVGYMFAIGFHYIWNSKIILLILPLLQ